MADAQYGEGRQFNLHTAGTDLVEGSGLAVAGASGAIVVGGFTETGSSALIALAVGGGTPSGSTDSGNPVKIGGYASSTVPTAVTAGQRVNAWFSLNGSLNVISRDASGAYVAPGGGTTDAAAWTTAVSSFSPVGGVYNDSATALTSGQQGTTRLTSGRKLHVADSDSLGQSQYNFPAGFVRTSDEPRQMFYDPFDGAVVDVTNRWTAAFALGNAVTPSQASGSLVVNAGSTSTGWATLTSQASFVPTIPAWLANSHALSFTDGAAFVSTGYRFWGVGTNPGTPTVASPMTDGVGFEITGGKMYAVVYAAGVRTAVQDLSAATGNSTAPTDTAMHRYIAYVRTDKTYWYIDSLATPVATSNFQSPAVQTLPVKYLAVSGGSATALTSAGIAVWDTGKNNTQLSDGTYPWRKAQVNAAGAQYVQTASNSQMGVNGDVAAGGTDSGNPVKIGGYASSTAPTAATAGQRVNAWLGLNGEQMAGTGPGFSRTITQVSVASAPNTTASIVTSGGGTLIVKASGTFTGLALTVEGSYDGGTTWVNAGNYHSFDLTNNKDGYSISGSNSNTYVWMVNAAAFRNVRANVTALASGTVLVDLTLSPAAFAKPWVNGGQGNAISVLANSTGAGLSDSVSSQLSQFGTFGGSTTHMNIHTSGMVYNGATWDRVRTITSLSTAPNFATGIMAAGIGPGFDLKTDPAGVPVTGILGTTNAVTVLTNGADMMVFQVTTIGVTPGSMIFEHTNDDTNWVTAGHVVKLASGPDQRVEGSFVPAVNDVYMVRCTGIRQVRYRVNAVYASGTATVKVTSSQGVSLLKGIDVGAAPHNMGYAIVSATAQYTTAQTSTTIGPTVSSTQRMVVTSIQIQAGGTVAGTQVSVYFGTGAYSRGTSKAIFDGEFAPSATSKPGYAQSPPVPYIGAADEELKITNVGAINPLTVTIWYYLVAA